MDKAQEIAAHVMQSAKEGIMIKPEDLAPKEEKRKKSNPISQRARSQKEPCLAMDTLNMC